MSLVLLNAVGLTPRLLPFAPRLQALANSGWVRPLREALPAVTCTAQATILTGKTATEHGIVGNGWLFRDTAEVRFWQQSNRLIQAEPLYATARRRAARAGRPFKLREALLVVQPGRGGRCQRDAQAALRRRWQQGLRHSRNARTVLPIALEANARPIPIPHVLGTDGGAAMHRVDRAVCRRGIERRAARSDTRLSASSRLRSAALRTQRLRHEAARRGTGRRLRSAARCCPEPGITRLGG